MAIASAVYTALESYTDFEIFTLNQLASKAQVDLKQVHGMLGSLKSRGKLYFRRRAYGVNHYTLKPVQQNFRL